MKFQLSTKISFVERIHGEYVEKLPITVRVKLNKLIQFLFGRYATVDISIQMTNHQRNVCCARVNIRINTRINRCKSNGNQYQ